MFLCAVCVYALTSNHDCADVGLAEVLQDTWSFCLQLVLHDDQTQEIHVGLYVIPVSNEDTNTLVLTIQKTSIVLLSRNHY